MKPHKSVMKPCEYPAILVTHNKSVLSSGVFPFFCPYFIYTYFFITIVNIHSFGFTLVSIFGPYKTNPHTLLCFTRKSYAIFCVSFG